MKNFNFIINNRIIEVTAEEFDQAGVLAKIIADQIELDKEQE